ncbi:MAG: hypothetical protein ACKO7W_07975 [Elainella sp.]
MALEALIHASEDGAEQAIFCILLLHRSGWTGLKKSGFAGKPDERFRRTQEIYRR